MPEYFRGLPSAQKKNDGQPCFQKGSSAACDADGNIIASGSVFGKGETERRNLICQEKSEGSFDRSQQGDSKLPLRPSW